jgi:hypothetical protein
MLGAYVASDLDIQSIAQCIPTKTSIARQQLFDQLVHPTTDLNKLKRLQLPVLALRKIDQTSLQTAIQTFGESEEAFQPSSSDELVQETTEQIVWNSSSTFGKICNRSPLLLESLLAWKTIALPAMTILAPLVAVLIPYLFLSLYGLQPSIQQYLQTIRQTVRGAITVPSLFQAKGESDRFGFVLESLYMCITIGIVLSSMWNQVTSALHLRSVAETLREKGRTLRSGLDAAQSILTCLKSYPAKIQRGVQHLIEEGTSVLEPFQTIQCTGLGLYARIWNDPTSLQPLVAWVGHVDSCVAIASLQTICFPRWTPHATQIDLQGVYHPALSNAVSNNFTLINQSASILTGPNRGGKSTFCKAVGISILCAQTLGIAFATNATLTPFARIETALSPADTLGRLSLFEAEIEFARSVVEADESPMFVMMDEIFHSTNAHDGVEASRVFLNRLYARPNTISLISTHYRSLADEYKETVSLLQAHTLPSPSGLQYTYKILPGISTASSVMEILQERGLLRAESSSLQKADPFCRT